MIYKLKNGALPRTPAPTTGDGFASWSLPPAALDKARLGWPLPWAPPPEAPSGCRRCPGSIRRYRQKPDCIQFSNRTTERETMTKNTCTNKSVSFGNSYLRARTGQEKSTHRVFRPCYDRVFKRESDPAIRCSSHA